MKIKDEELLSILLNEFIKTRCTPVEEYNEDTLHSTPLLELLHDSDYEINLQDVKGQLGIVLQRIKSKHEDNDE